MGHRHFRISLPPSSYCSRSCLVRRFLKSSKAAPLNFFYLIFIFFVGSRELTLRRGEVEGMVPSALLVRNDCGTGVNIET